MANAEQIKSLIRFHFDGDKERFMTLALQIAATEARKGHGLFAHELKELVDKGIKNNKKGKVLTLKVNLNDLLLETKTTHRLSNLVMNSGLENRILRILREFENKDSLKQHGLNYRRKILLHGLPGTGKTMTASVIAGETKLPFYTILMDRLVTKFMGETSAKLRQIFSFIQENPAIYLFDEFDAIGTERAKDNDVGEMRRVLNSFLQFIELDDSDSFIIAATNSVNTLDSALFRRFDDIIEFSLPDKNQISSLIKNKLNSFNGEFNLKEVIDAAYGLSHAEITLACLDSIKEAIMDNRKKVYKKSLLNMFKERKKV